MAKTALITGVTGQDGAYLAEFLIGKGYAVHGIKRRTSLFNTDRVDHLFHESARGRPALHPPSRRHDRFLEPAARGRRGAARRGLQPRRPEPRHGVVRGAGIHRQRRRHRHAAPARGDPHPRPRQEDALLPGLDLGALRQGRRDPQSETTPFHPRSPYGVAKLYAHWITVNYREAYGFFACSGILFNHESPIRGETFVTRKITRGAGAHRARLAGLPLPRQPQCPARLGPQPAIMSRRSG